jgi:diguanylate cyclase (GGDEF)-like protein
LAEPVSIERVSKEVETELSNWSERAIQYYRTKTEEVRDIMVVVARAANCIGERDQRYVKQVGDLSDRLLAAARLEDLAAIRQSLKGNAGELKLASEAMMKSSRESVAELRTELVRYETLLQESERRALIDPLTGLQNRRGIEEELRGRVERQQRFCVLIFDLNEFKKLNDTYGHVAGDDILRQFANELKTNCEHGDTAGRLGGDEFIVITDRRREDAEQYLRRIRDWIFGNYKINDGQRCHTAELTGSAGLAAWDGKESIAALLSRADQAMYREKAIASNAQRKPFSLFK